MAIIKINVADFGAVSQPGDRVVFYAPVFRTSSDGRRVVSTAPRPVYLTDGVATVEQVDAGPLMVEFACRNLVNSGPFRVVVPEADGTYDLHTLLADSYDLEPEVLSQVKSILSRAEAIEEQMSGLLDGSREAVDRLGTAAELERWLKDSTVLGEQAKVSADSAGKSASAADASARAAASTAEQVKSGVSAAAASAQAAAGSAGDAQAAADAAAVSAGAASDGAVAARSQAESAAGSADRARGAASEAGDSAAQAVRFAGDAQGAASAAQGSASDAAVSAAEAAGSVDAVVASATAARDSASAAAGSATSAGQSATDAQGWAAKSEQSAGEAAGSATSAKADADRAERVAESTSWDGDVLTVNGKSSPSLRGPKGADGVVTFDDLTDEQRESLKGADGAKSWDELEGKPAEFTPAAHVHRIADVEGLQGALDAAATAEHTHTISEVNGLQSELDGKAAASHSHTWGEVTGKPTTFPPSTHAHSWADITSKPTEFTPSAHTHSISDVEGLRQTLDGKADASHTHPLVQNDPQDGEVVAREGGVWRSIPASQVVTSGGGYVKPEGGIPSTDLAQDLKNMKAEFDGATYSATAGALMKRTSTGAVSVADPTANAHAANKKYVDGVAATKADVSQLPKIQVVSALPSSPDASTLYLVKE